MKIAAGNIWYKSGVRVIPTNGMVKKANQAVMGAGLAAQAAARYSELPKQLGERLISTGNHCYYFPDFSIITFPTKHDWKDSSTIELIKASTIELLQLVDVNEIKEVMIPPVGCGLGNLLWKDVEKVLYKYLDDRFTVVFYSNFEL